MRYGQIENLHSQKLFWQLVYRNLLSKRLPLPEMIQVAIKIGLDIRNACSDHVLILC